jgi:hypothetical protein
MARLQVLHVNIGGGEPGPAARLLAIAGHGTSHRVRVKFPASAVIAVAI